MTRTEGENPTQGIGLASFVYHVYLPFTLLDPSVYENPRWRQHWQGNVETCYSWNCYTHLHM
jgi:hypothetical protein